MAITVPASADVTPGKSTFATLKRDVLDWTVGSQDDPDLDRLAGTAVNQAIMRMNSRNWTKLVRMQDLALSVDVSSYALNSDFRNPRSLLRLNSSGKIEGKLWFKDDKTLDNEHPYTTSAVTAGSDYPRYYTIDYDARYLELVYPPSQTFVDSYPNLRLRYFYRQARLVGPSEVLTFPPEFELFVLWYARQYVAGVEAPSKLAAAKVLTDEVWRELKADDTDTLSDWSDY